MSLSARLQLLILVATLIPAIMVTVNFLEYREVEIAAARRQLSAMAQHIAQDLGETVRGTAQLHFGLSRARDLDTRDRAACSAFLATVLKAHPQYTGILTITPDGDLYCDSLSTGKALHLADRRYFQQARDSKDPLAVEPAFGRLTGIAVLQIAYAVRHDTGELKFVQLASLNLDKYAQSRSTNLPFESAVLALLDVKGTMLAFHPGGERLRGTSFAGSPLHRLARGREDGDAPEGIDVDGESRVWASAALSGFPGAGLHILVGVPKADLVAEANRRLNRALSILALFLLLALGSAWALAELGVRRPSARIISAVARFSRGDFNARIGKPHPRGEIGDLMAALDSGFELVQKQRDAIQRLNTDLESRAAERKRAEEVLRAAEEQFRGLVEQSIAGIYIIQDDKLAYVNQRYARIFGYDSAVELIGRHRLFMVPERDRATVFKRILQQSEGNSSFSYDFSAECKDGSTIEIGAHASRATHLGRPAIIGLMQDISEKKRAEEQIQRYMEQLKTALMSTVGVVTNLSEMRDPYRAGHERRVAQIAAAIGAQLGLDAQRIEGLRVAGSLHDIGTISIPSEILSKPGKLGALEFKLIQGHAQAGYDVLKDVAFPWPVAEVALQHHERIDGSGYPQGLKGEAILLEARIMAVADVVEAMSSHRPYRPGLGIDKALAEIERGRGTAYDPDVANACLKLFREQGYSIPA